MSKKLLSRKSTSEIIVRVVAFTIMFVHCALIIYVFLYGLNASLRWDGRSFMRDPNALAIFTNPEKGIFEPRFENYILAFKLLEDTSYSYFSMVINSIWYSIGGTLFSLTIAACSTYIVAKYKNKFTRSIFALCLFNNLHKFAHFKNNS